MPVYWHKEIRRPTPVGRAVSEVGVAVRVMLAAVVLVYLAALGLGALAVWRVLP